MKKRKPKNKKDKNCMNCSNAVGLEDGGIMCDLNNEVVMDEYQPTDKYTWCNGRMFEEEI